MYSIEGEFVTRPEAELEPGVLVEHTSKVIEVTSAELPEIPQVVAKEMKEGHQLTDAFIKLWDDQDAPTPQDQSRKIGKLVAYKLFTEEQGKWTDMFENFECEREITSTLDPQDPNSEKPIIIISTGPLKISN